MMYYIIFCVSFWLGWVICAYFAAERHEAAVTKAYNDGMKDGKDSMTRHLMEASRKARMASIVGMGEKI
jgi:hypothetical protein